MLKSCSKNKTLAFAVLTLITVKASSANIELPDLERGEWEIGSSSQVKNGQVIRIPRRNAGCQSPTEFIARDMKKDQCEPKLVSRKTGEYEYDLKCSADAGAPRVLNVKIRSQNKRGFFLTIRANDSVSTLEGHWVKKCQGPN